jgi:hypothetical protein
MRYHGASHLDYSGMPLYLLHMHLVEFRKVHNIEMKVRMRLAGVKLGN